MIHLPLTAHCPNSSSLKIIVQGREGGTSPAEVPSVAATTTATTTTTRAPHSPFPAASLASCPPPCAHTSVSARQGIPDPFSGYSQWNEWNL